MSATHTKSTFLYGQVRRALQSGRYVPGERIDPATLAAEFNTSPTPVRFALYRLVGEGLISDHARTGLYVPLLNEIALHDLYDWMCRLLVMACEIGPTPRVRKVRQLDFNSADNDIVKQTWQLFDAIAHATGHLRLNFQVQRRHIRVLPCPKPTIT